MGCKDTESNEGQKKAEFLNKEGKQLGQVAIYAKDY